MSKKIRGPLVREGLIFYAGKISIQLVSLLTVHVALVVVLELLYVNYNRIDLITFEAGIA